ncbi:fructosamine kinase family protein [Mariniblastus fucicola]|uniref:Fructosamine kinase n=1 Tax=Mariniblastus fucicola TaxID=980251 RepID=A0A5B9PA00_9BACT|nr:fructosamine kinase family protein [Mariniblastus fucicola]QEG22095.1 Fructosamine kinase [Mariniblastus fucicola]
MSTSNFITLGEAAVRFPDFDLPSGLNDQTRVFVKSSHNDVFGQEAAGLESLRRTDSIRIAEVIYVSQREPFVLILKAIESTPPSADFFERFARKLAQMHRCSAEQFGFEHDNFLGATAQPNSWTSDWVEFWAVHRLGFQLRLAADNGLGGSELQRLGQALIHRLDEQIGGSNERPALIHGDLWSGNWLCDEHGEPALIDPAVYFANREAEFGMTTLFGGLPPRFYGAYREAWPLEDGWEDRVAVYRLYHLLNHLNLFGSSYLGECLESLRRFG